LHGLQPSQLSVHKEFTAPEILQSGEQGQNFLVSTPENEEPDQISSFNDP
jgi:hypothetical protein